MKDIERVIISHLLNYPSKIPDAMFFIGQKETFFKDQNLSVIFDIMAKMHLGQKPITINGLALEIKADKRIEKEPISYLADIMQSEIIHASEFNAIMLFGVEQYLYRQLNHLQLKIQASMQHQKHPIEIINDVDMQMKEIAQDIDFSNNIDISKLINESIKDLIKRFDKGEDIGTSSGFHSLDELHGRFLPGTLSVVAARPAMGKTAFSLSMAVNVAKQNKSVMFFSIEMSNMEMMGRMISQVAYVQNSLILKATHKLNQEEFSRIYKAADILAKYNIKMIDQGNQTIGKIKMQIAKHKPEFVIIDYLQIITPERNTHGDNPNLFYESLTRDLKITAKEYNCTIILLSQLNRAVESRAEKRPILADLRSSGGIEQNADSVMFIHRPYYYDQTQQIDLAEIIVAKNRNGKVGKCELKFMDVFTLFQNDSSLPNIYNPIQARTPYKDESNPF